MDVDYKGFLSALGKRIKHLRNERGLSLRDMVVTHGYHDSQWRKYEAGGGLTIPSLLRIASVFEMSLSALLDGLSEYPVKSAAELRFPVSKSAVKKAGPKKMARTTARKRP